MGVLDGKIALITAGSSGIGRATVELFAQEGARVVVADVNAPDPSVLGANVKYVRCDVLREDDVRNAVAFTVREFGELDFLFNNVGAEGTTANCADMPQDGWDLTMALCLRSVMFGIKHGTPSLKRRGGGSIVNTASVAGVRAGISTVAYSVAKAGIIHLTRMAALEFAGDRIRVNAICPGVIPTPAVAAHFGVPPAAQGAFMKDLASEFATLQPLPRMATPKDIAQTALFLASDASSFTTGQALVVDGGMLTLGPGSMEVGAGPSAMDRAIALSAKHRG